MKQIISIKFDWKNNQLVVTYDNETIATYQPTDVVRYVEENPGREADVIAMGWS